MPFILYKNLCVRCNIIEKVVSMSQNSAFLLLNQRTEYSSQFKQSKMDNLRASAQQPQRMMYHTVRSLTESRVEKHI
jgi:hypothetical protein